METIEKRAAEYEEISGCYGCELAQVKQAFIAGAQSEHEELTQWHDPNVEKPVDYKPVEVKYSRGGHICYAVAYLRFHEIWIIDWTKQIIDPYNVIGWREIQE